MVQAAQVVLYGVAFEPGGRTEFFLLDPLRFGRVTVDGPKAQRGASAMRNLSGTAGIDISKSRLVSKIIL